MMKTSGTLRDGLRRLRAILRRDGAQQSGLSSLTELSFVNAAGDALVTVALAGSLFFSVSPGEARSRVALYLLITMVPFVLLAPVIGPLLDRVAYGRRTALAAICLARGLLAWQLATALDSLAVYPLALGLLMLSRGFGVARSAVIPRVTPPELTLVKVNSRISLVNIVAGAVVAPVGLGIAEIPFIGYPWVLRICAVVYMAGVLLAFNLPGHVDSAAGERPLRNPTRTARPSLRERLAAVVGALPAALQAALVLRGLVGFLTFYLAFLLRTSGGNNIWLGALAVAAGAGSGIGVFVGGRLGRRRPEGILLLGLLLATAGCVGAAITHNRFTSLLAALLAMTAGSMGKLALDAVLQRDIPEENRNSAFARSETALQLSWVIGGAFGLIPMPGPLGFTLAAAVTALTLAGQRRTLRQARLQARARRAAGRPADAPAAGGGPVLSTAHQPPTVAGQRRQPAEAPPEEDGLEAMAWPGAGGAFSAAQTDDRDPDATNPLGHPPVSRVPPPPPPPCPSPPPSSPASTPASPSLSSRRRPAAPLPKTLEDPDPPDGPTRPRRWLRRR